MIDWLKQMIQKIHNKLLKCIEVTTPITREVCTQQLCGGLNIFNLQLHTLARKATLLPRFVEQTLLWARMLSDMFDNLISNKKKVVWLMGY